MGMMKMIGNVGRKFRTAYMKKARRKTDMPKLSDDWAARNRAGDPSARTEFVKQQNSAEAYIQNKVAKRQADYDAGYPNDRPARKKMDAVIPRESKKTRITFKGQDMQKRNFMKSHKMVGGYKYGSFVSKEAYRTGGKKAVADSYGRKGFTNYKTRVYQP